MNNLMYFADVAMAPQIENTSGYSLIGPIFVVLAMCLLFTIVIESLGALMFRVRGRNLGIVMLAQIVTNPLVVLITNFVRFITNSDAIFFAAMVLMELCAFFVEAIMYKKFFKDYTANNCYVLSFSLNIFSIMMGFIMILVISAIMAPVSIL